MSIGVFMPNIIAASEIRVVLPAGKLPFDRMDLFFTPEQWASPVTKRIVVEHGTEVWHGDYGYTLAITGAGAGQSGSFNGRLILENNGFMSGKGGAANGEVGGDVINANFSGRNGQKLEIINNGIIRAGGGGGGRGGTGGGGTVSTTVREPATGEIYEYLQYEWTTSGFNNTLGIYWAGVVDYRGSPPNYDSITSFKWEFGLIIEGHCD